MVIKKKYTFLLIFILILVVIVLFVKSEFVSTKTKKIHFGNKIVNILLADTQQKRIHGLSDKKVLESNTIMLFVFDYPDYEGIWMKDMNFPIDIVWLDANMNVIDYKDNVSPDTYPVVFYPKEKSMYVVEAIAGSRVANGVDIGTKLYYK